jgi:hypothetical protein
LHWKVCRLLGLDNAVDINRRVAVLIHQIRSFDKVEMGAKVLKLFQLLIAAIPDILRLR